MCVCPTGVVIRPAAAVIPAPIAYIKVVAVKKFVVECLGPVAVGLVLALAVRCPSLQGRPWQATAAVRPASITVNKLECLKRAGLLEYISME